MVQERNGAKPCWELEQVSEEVREGRRGLSRILTTGERREMEW
jgi:hypothetical protein